MIILWARNAGLRLDFNRLLSERNNLRQEMINLEKHSLREVMEMTREMPISEGGLRFLIEKMISEIEKIQRQIDESK